jgi:hypothetical protein
MIRNRLLRTLEQRHDALATIGADADDSARTRWHGEEFLDALTEFARACTTGTDNSTASWAASAQSMRENGVRTPGAMKMSGINQRSVRNAARSSDTKIAGSSHAAKCPPRSAAL